MQRFTLRASRTQVESIRTAHTTSAAPNSVQNTNTVEPGVRSIGTPSARAGVPTTKSSAKTVAKPRS